MSASTSPWIFDVRTVVFSGGAIKGHAFVGAIEVLETLWAERDESFLDQVRSWAGVSIGAFVALACVLRVPGVRLGEWFSVQDPVDALFDGVARWGIWADAVSNCGLLRRDVLEERILAFMGLFWPSNISEVPSREDLRAITFRTFRDITGRSLHVGASNLTTEKYELFGPDATPDLSVVLGISVSMSAPLLFHPTTIDGHWYVDGGLYNNFPVNAFDPADVLGIRVTELGGLPPGELDPAQYASCVVLRTMDVREDQLTALLPCAYHPRVIRLVVPNLSSPLGMVASDSSTLATYVRRGRACTLAFLCDLFLTSGLLGSSDQHKGKL